MQNQYRVVYAGGVGRLHKTYFNNYGNAVTFFSRVAKRLHPMGYVELQELEAGAYLTVEQQVGGGLQ